MHQRAAIIVEITIGLQVKLKAPFHLPVKLALQLQQLLRFLMHAILFQSHYSILPN